MLANPNISHLPVEAKQSVYNSFQQKQLNTKWKGWISNRSACNQETFEWHRPKLVLRLLNWTWPRIHFHTLGNYFGCHPAAWQCRSIILHTGKGTSFWMHDTAMLRMVSYSIVLLAGTRQTQEPLCLWPLKSKPELRCWFGPFMTSI